MKECVRKALRHSLHCREACLGYGLSEWLVGPLTGTRCEQRIKAER